jgi:diguanylate cyclase
VQVGERLTAVARREDIVGRLGGDEFLIVGSAQDTGAAGVCPAAPGLCGVYFGEQRIDYAGASFGVITCDPQSIDVEAALRAADEAMYQDKKSRRRRISFILTKVPRYPVSCRASFVGTGTLS